MKNRELNGNIYDTRNSGNKLCKHCSNGGTCNAPIKYDYKKQIQTDVKEC